MRDSSDRFGRLQDLFHELDSLDPSVRQQKIDQITSHDPALGSDLRRLFSESALRLDQGVEKLADSTQITPARRRDFGPYVTTRLLGEGGMGEVFEALQEEPIQRRVAIKVIRRGLESPLAMGRFLAERQALAALEHPNIARVYDGGSIDDVPWFAMELIEGTDILSYCDEARSTIRERIQLFIPVCRAVSHAHRRGLLHRDLKPSNLLVVADREEGPTPKVIDFGIAKAIDDDAQSSKSLTRTGSVLGTPDYMSPEQAAGGGLDLDTRSDVYSLGLVLYELVTGDLPIPRNQRLTLSFDQLRDRLHSGDTPLASRRVRSLAGSDEGETVARRRATNGGSLVRQLRGDLDWVLSRALAQNRDERYESPEALAQDLERYLTGDPVEAGPPTLRRRLRSLIHRHRTASIVVTSTGAALTLGLIISLTLFFEARRNAKNAERQRATAERTADFLETLFRSADPRQHAGQEPSVRDLVDSGVVAIDEELAEEPAVHARMLLTLGDVSTSLSDYDRAQSLLERLLEEHDNEAVPQETIIEATNRLAAVFREREEPAEAEVLYRKALKRARAVGNEGQVGMILNDLGIVLRRQHRFDEALEVLEEALTIARRASQDPSTDPAVASALNNLATARATSGDYEGAREQGQEALSIFAAILPETHPNLATLNANLSVFARNVGMLSSARDHAHKSVAISRVALPEGHPSIAMDLHGLSSAELWLGNYEAAARGFSEAVEIHTRKFGEQAFQLADPLQGLAHARLSSGDLEGAVEAYRRALAVLDSSSHPGAMFRRRVSLRGLSTALRLSGGLDEAYTEAHRTQQLAEQTLFSEGLSDRDRTRAMDDRDLALLQIAQIELERGREDSAKDYYRQSTARCDGACFLDNPRATVYRGAFLAKSGERTLALEALEWALEDNHLCAWAFDNPDVRSIGNGPELVALSERFRELSSR